MSRYIDADRAIESLFDYCNGKKTIGQCIDDTPTEEVKPIVYGEWIKVKKVPCYDIKGVRTLGVEYKCNKCGIIHTVIEDFGHYNFCPNCSADMRKKSEEDKSPCYTCPLDCDTTCEIYKMWLWKTEENEEEE